MLAVIDVRFGGVPPKVQDMLRKGAELWRLHFATIRHGGMGGVAGRLFALPDTIVAYMIAIGAQTYTNTEALRLMRRDCMSEHLLLEGRVMVSRSEEHTSELKSLMRISYAVFCLKQKTH